MITELTLDKLPKKVLAKIDLQTAFMASRCVVAAERLQVFRKLHNKELSAAAIGRATGIRGWRIEVFLAALVSLGLLKRKGNKYRNSALAEKYYVRERSINWTRLYSAECAQEYLAFSVLEEMLTTGKDLETILGLKQKHYVDQMRSNPQWAHDFTYMLYYDHFPAGLALAKNLDLSNYTSVLDVGGGSGVMSIALARRFKHLKACVLDIESVVKVTRKIIRREKLARRVSTLVGDMTRRIPSGYDVIMFCDAELNSVELYKRAYDSLPDGGLIVLVENFISEDWTEPLYKLMWQIRSNRIWLASRNQVVQRLKESGFKAIKKRKIFQDVWLITGRK